jgi:biopolymer transport protein ExbD
MAFGGFDSHEIDRPTPEINMVPLIDVMLVLLIIFIVTAPLLTHAIKIQLPTASNQVNLEKPETVTLSLNAAGAAFWNDKPVEEAELPALFAEAAAHQPQPELHLRAEKTTEYQRVAEVMAMSQRAGLTRVGFITEPLHK